MEDLLWCDARDARAGPMTKGSMGRDLVLRVMDGQISYDHDAVKFRDEKKKKKAAPSSQRGILTQK